MICEGGERIRQFLHSSGPSLLMRIYIRAVEGGTVLFALFFFHMRSVLRCMLEMVLAACSVVPICTAACNMVPTSQAQGI
jgi:hypothetical protein